MSEEPAKVKKTVRELRRALDAIRKFGKLKHSPSAVVALVINQSRLETVMAPFEKAKRALWAELFGQEATVVPPEHQHRSEFLNRNNEMDETEVEFEPYMFEFTALNISENEMDPDAIVGIGWLMKGMPK